VLEEEKLEAIRRVILVTVSRLSKHLQSRSDDIACIGDGEKRIAKNDKQTLLFFLYHAKLAIAQPIHFNSELYNFSRRLK
jgi:hypothetical protein